MGREYVLKNYNFDDFGKRWDKVFTMIKEKYGSWETRKERKTWELLEV